jgi:hypothetical protein
MISGDRERGKARGVGSGVQSEVQWVCDDGMWVGGEYCGSSFFALYLPHMYVSMKRFCNASVLRLPQVPLLTRRPHRLQDQS